MRLLLVNVGSGDTDFMDKGKVYRSVYRRPYLGIQYLSSYLKQHGHQVDLIDTQVEPLAPPQIAERVRNADYGLVGFFAIYVNREQVLEYTRELKRSSPVPIAIGGPDCFNDAEYLRNGVDVVVRGEGEVTLLEMVERMEAGRALDGVLGLSTSKDGALHREGDRPFVPEIDSFPFPDRSHYPIHVWHDYMDFNMRKPFTTFMTSRGCPYGCEFCDSPTIWQRKVRQRSVENTMAEVDELVGRYGVRYIVFSDDIFGIQLDWLRGFSEEMVRRAYDLRFFCLIHPQVYGRDTEERIALLARAGCRTLHLGIQSGSGEVLRSCGRSASELKHPQRIVAAARANGILTFTTFIHGLPGDTVEGIRQSRDLVKEVSPHYTLFLPLKVFAGSALERKLDSGERELPSFSYEHLVRECRRSELSFYANPMRLLRLVGYIVRRNPTWILKRGWYAFYMMARTIMVGLLPAAQPRVRHAATLPSLVPS